MPLLENKGYESLKKLANLIAKKLTEKQNEDEDIPKKILHLKKLYLVVRALLEKYYPYEKIVGIKFQT